MPEYMAYGIHINMYKLINIFLYAGLYIAAEDYA